MAKKKPETESVETKLPPILDPTFREPSLSVGGLLDRRRFEENLIRYGLLNKGSASAGSITSPLILPPYGTASGQTGEIRFLELAAGGTDYVGFKAPDNISNSVVWTLPAADGTAGQFLATDGANHMIWLWPYWEKSGDDIFYSLGNVSIGDVPNSTYKLYVKGKILIEDDAGSCALVISNKSATAYDPMIQFSVGATPSVISSFGVDDSDGNTTKLCIGSALSDTHYGATVWQYTPAGDYIDIFPKTYINNSLYAGYPDGTIGADTEIELDVWDNSESGSLGGVDIYNGFVNLWAYGTVAAPATALVSVESRGYIDLWVDDPTGSTDDAWIGIYGGTWNGDGVPEIWSDADVWYLGGHVNFGRHHSGARHSEFRFIEHNSGSDYEYVGIEAPDDITTSYTLTLPAADSTGTQALVSNGAGVLSWASFAAASHNILSATHGDTLADTVIDGDLIIGNVTPKWSRLPISVPAANVRNVLGIDNGELRPSWKSALDATAPTNISEGAAAAAGTSLVFAHRDHTHGAPATWTPSAHNHDSDYISIIAAPAANHFPYQTLGGELVDSSYDAASFDAAGSAAGAVSSHEGTYNHANYNTAYGWGNHASAGYLTSVTAHNLLSATHGDTTTGAVVRGDIITGQGASPNTKWVRLAVGAANTLLKSDGTDVAYDTLLGIPALADPGADRILFWDETDNAAKWLACGNSISIVGTTIDTIQDLRTTAHPSFEGWTVVGSGGSPTVLITEESGPIRFNAIVYSNVAGDEPQYVLGHSRGTIAVPVKTESGDELGTFYFSGYSAAQGQIRVSAAIRGYADAEWDSGGDTTDTPGRMEFQTIPDGSNALATRLIIKNDGKVGINDPSPAEILDVGGNINLTGVYKVGDLQVVGSRVIDARCDDAINSGDATTDGVIDALRDAMIAHGLIASA